MSLSVVILGGGDLASGVALRLFRAGAQVLITELAKPTMVRRWVSFGEAMYRGEFSVEDVTARYAHDLGEAAELLKQRILPVIADPDGCIVQKLGETTTAAKPLVLVDARMRKIAPEYDKSAATMVIGLGPGFIAGENCHAVVETNRGHFLGRVIWQGSAENDTGIPDQVQGFDAERVLRSPADGIVETCAEIGQTMQPGQIVARVAEHDIFSPFAGIVRGLIHAGLLVKSGTKIGDIDPRSDPRYCTLVSDKSLAVGGGVLEAILMQEDLRTSFWDEIETD